MGGDSSLWAGDGGVRGVGPGSTCPVCGSQGQLTWAKLLLPKPQFPVYKWVWSCVLFSALWLWGCGDTAIGLGWWINREIPFDCSVFLFLMLFSAVSWEPTCFSLDLVWGCVLGGGDANGRVSIFGWVRLAHVEG